MKEQEIADWFAGFNACLSMQGNALYEAIKHGDDAHRAWLKSAIEAFYSGLPVPPDAQPSNKDIQDNVMAAVKNLIAVKGRFHTEQAFVRLVGAYDAAIAQSAGKTA